MLDNRLKKIFDLCPECDCMADIGTDHGHLPAELVRCGRTKYAIACDISEPSLKKAEFTARFSGLSDKIETRLGFGLEPVKMGEVSCVVIAGMGGALISDILKSACDKITDEVFILQPMTSVSELRRSLKDNGFCITDEEMAEEGGRLYNIICAELGSMGEYDFECGSVLFEKRHPLLKKQLEMNVIKFEGKIESFLLNESGALLVLYVKKKLM